MGLLYLYLKRWPQEFKFGLPFGGRISCFMRKVQNISLTIVKAMTISHYVDLNFSNGMFNFQ
jgi:hypothetical protein